MLVLKFKCSSVLKLKRFLKRFEFHLCFIYLYQTFRNILVSVGELKVGFSLGIV